MFRVFLQRLAPVAAEVSQQAQRHFGVSTVAAQKANLDPIQQLFVDKIRDYRNKSAGGKLVDATPETEATLKDMMAALERSYQATGVDMTQFPTLNFQDPELQWPGLTEEQATNMYEAADAEAAKTSEDAAEKDIKFDPFEGLPRL